MTAAASVADTHPVGMARPSTTPQHRPRLLALDRWTVLTALAVLGLVGVYVYDVAFVGHYLVAQWRWSPTRTDWLFGGSLLVLWVIAGLPSVRHPDRTRDRWQRLRSRPGALAALAVIVVVFVLGTVGPAVFEPPTIHFLRAFQPPAFTSIDATPLASCVGPETGGRCYGTLQFPLGTNGYGNGVLYLVVVGARVTTYVAVVTAALVVPLGAVVGALAGYYGGVVDAVLMGYVDVQQTIPAVVLYILAILVLGQGLFLLLLVFGLFSWGGIARIVRSEVLHVRNEEYVLSGRALGGPDWYLLRRHVVPNVSHSIVPSLAHQIAILLLTQAALAFLDLGDIDQVSWGRSIAAGLGGDLPMLTQWWVALFPALALALTVVAVKVFGDHLRDVLDPRGA